MLSRSAASRCSIVIVIALTSHCLTGASPASCVLQETFDQHPTRGSAESFAANLWKLQRKAHELLGRDVRPFCSSPASRSLRIARSVRPAHLPLPRNGGSVWSRLGVQLERCYHERFIIARI